MLEPINDSPVTNPLYSIIFLDVNVFAEVKIILSYFYFTKFIIAQIIKNIAITIYNIILLLFVCFNLASQTFWQSGEQTSSFNGIGVPQIGQCLCGSTAILSSPIF